LYMGVGDGAGCVVLLFMGSWFESEGVILLDIGLKQGVVLIYQLLAGAVHKEHVVASVRSLSLHRRGQLILGEPLAGL